MDMGLQDKVALVTGSATGLGRAISLALAAEGAKIVVADMDDAGAAKVVETIRAGGGQARAAHVDVRESAQVQAMVQQALEAFGRIDILVTNAGVVGPQGPWADLPEEGFDYVVGVDFRGVYLCCKYVVPHMIAQKSGKIINISSCAGNTGEQFNGVYSACKGAVWNMTHSLAAELGPHNINVNAVCPAAMDTDLMEKVYRERSAYFGIPPDDLRKKIKGSYLLPRDLTVKDAAAVTVFLASEQANMMTGQGVNITAGIEMH